MVSLGTIIFKIVGFVYVNCFVVARFTEMLCRKETNPYNYLFER